MRGRRTGPGSNNSGQHSSSTAVVLAVCRSTPARDRARGRPGDIFERSPDLATLATRIGALAIRAAAGRALRLRHRWPRRHAAGPAPPPPTRSRPRPPLAGGPHRARELQRLPGRCCAGRDLRPGEPGVVPDAPASGRAAPRARPSYQRVKISQGVRWRPGLDRPDGTALPGRLYRRTRRGAAGVRMSAPPILQSALLTGVAGVRHGFFTRQGGVSRGVYASLNVGVGSATPRPMWPWNCAGAAAAVFARSSNARHSYQIHSRGWSPPTASGWQIVRRRTAVSRRARADLVSRLSARLRADPAGRAWTRAVRPRRLARYWRRRRGGGGGDGRPGRGADTDRRVDRPRLGPASCEVGLEFLGRLEGARREFLLVLRRRRLGRASGCSTCRGSCSRLAAGVTQSEWIGFDTHADDVVVLLQPPRLPSGRYRLRLGCCRRSCWRG